MRILVPIDGSTNSLNAVSFIATRQTLLGSNPSIELLNIQQPLPARACRLVGQDALTRYYEDEAAKVFEPARKIAAVTAIYNKVKAGDICQAKVEAYYQEGMRLLEQVQVEQGCKCFLQEFVTGLMHRNL